MSLRLRVMLALCASLLALPAFAAHRDFDPYISGGRDCKADHHISGGGGYSLVSGSAEL